MSNNYFILGQPYDKAAKNKVFILNIYDHVDYIKAADYGETDEIDPKSYFITSGDAVQKTIYMISQLQALEKRHKNKYRRAVKKNILKAEALLALLIDARGSDCFLETEWENHNLKVVPKNPRKQ
jgi:hypothetical protein